MNLLTTLKLGRVSNLPTIWSNVLAGAILANVAIDPASVFIILVAISLIYTSGMFFNDVFDQQFDRQHRASRPIPAGEVGSSTVQFWASAMMLIALVLFSINISFSAIETWYPVLSCLILCALVLLYDLWHKENPYGPLVMGLCRGMVYITAAITLAPQFSLQLILSALSLTVWVLGLTMVAKKKNIFAGFIVLIVSVNVILLSAINNIFSLNEFIILSVASLALIYVFVYHCNGKYWNSVTLLVASISLLDALVIASVAGVFNYLSMTAVGLFFLTLFFQRFIEGS